MFLKWAFLGLALGVVGCGSSDSSSGGGSCTVNPDKDPVFTSVAKAAGSDAQCPDLTPADLNGGGDSGASACSYVTNKAACTLDIQCDDGTAQSTGSFKLTGSSFSGEISVTAGSLTCKYTTSGSTG
jgi:hypothetical protein